MEKIAPSTKKNQGDQIAAHHGYRWTFILLAAFWTIFIAGFSLWDYRQALRMTKDLATHACQTAWEKDVIYRGWASQHGGVYVPVTATTQPNPYLSHIPEREITTPSGRKLTLINPAYMNRQVFELGQETLGAHGHITSLNPLRPENAPDPWEALALKNFEQGAIEVHSLVDLDGELFMRMMRPLKTEKGCLKCHEQQGYKEGDIRGGISISVPWKPYRIHFLEKIYPFLWGMASVWLVGIIGLFLSTRQIHSLFAKLEETQAMLVHQEKMSSLGQMTAGIAHEINNPLAFVLGNEQVLQRDLDDLLLFINTLGDRLPEIALCAPQIHAEIIQKAAEIELDYLAEMLPRKISANIEGLERVKDIILDLRSFSRLDEAAEKYCDLNEGIAATLRFLIPLYTEYGVTIETDFAPLAPLLCAPGPLNQAISNITANAIQASQPGQSVRISTRKEGEEYVIEVSDKGCGIAAEHLNKIFDPFFTTKAVGAGTGLGLSITHQIIKAQGGRIEIDSTPDQGTTMRIVLPAKG